ncbi:aminoacylase-1B [Salvia hispanica]|uniref:aminoacylase-1B n=1 Tax=Salvia hispanica TaxID=49212 RepID=UPI002009A2C8|nr:aminoacylase-1B [Salvia hispanica]XP_047982177.1 aminoacylase-1B [Salvia hispanica]XP_047982178.1 aminoacylase-1B [Salvia hispanica]
MTTRRQPLISAAMVLLFLSPLSASDAKESDPISRFQNYLRINTAHPKPNYTAAVEYLTSFAATIPTLQTRILYLTTPDKPLLLITWPGSDPSLSSILLNSHLDSVPAEPSKWLHPPFAAHRTADGRIYARGAQDDKCIGMQYLEAIRELKKSNLDHTPLRTVHISYVPEEEIGGFDGMMKFVETREFEELNIGFMLDEGQASVSDEFRVFYADRSPWHVVIRARGEPGHGSRMFDGGAMENLMKSVEMMMKFRETSFDLVKAGLAANSEVISVNPVFLNAGIKFNDGYVMNLQPSEAEAGFDIRMTPSADPDLMRRRIAEEWAPTWRNMTYEITEKGPLRDFKGRPLMTATDGSNPWWTVFNQAIAAAGGRLAKPEILASTTDARFLRQLGIPTFGFSPMKNTPILLHDHNEFLQDSVYLEGIKVYEHVIRFLSSFDGDSVAKQDV